MHIDFKIKSFRKVKNWKNIFKRPTLKRIKKFKKLNLKNFEFTFHLLLKIYQTKVLNGRKRSRYVCIKLHVFLDTVSENLKLNEN